MRKMFLFFALISITSSQIAAQKKGCDICAISNRKPDTLLVSDFVIPSPPNHAPVNVQLIDTRADSSKIGYSERGAQSYYPCQLEGGTRKGFIPLLQATLIDKIPDSCSVIGIIHQFWIYEYDSLEHSANYRWKPAYRCNKLVFNADYFLKIGHDYYPLVKIDTSMIIIGSGTVGKEKIINRLLDHHQQKFAEIDIQNTVKKKAYDWNQIRTTLPIYAVNLPDSLVQEGIYVTYEEFMNNKPSLPYAGINEDKFADVLYTKDEKGALSSIREVWGYSDGHNAFIRLHNNFFRLVKVGNTYETYGFTNLSGMRGNNNITLTMSTAMAGGAIINAIDKSKELRAYYFPIQVDINTGSIY